VAEHQITPDRTALGWSVPDLGRAKIMIPAGRSDAVAIAIAESGHDTIHLLEGIRGRSIVRTVLPILSRRSARVGVISEAVNSHGIGGHLRRFAYTCGSLRYGSNLDFILAMGSQGVAWYRECRFQESKIFPFAYVTEAQAGCIPQETRPQMSAEFGIAFVGQLVPRKGGDLLLRALASQTERNWRLRMMGEGECRAAWERLARMLGISDKVSFTGALPNKDGRKIIGSADLLVLPSRYDGWGAVVNEALMQGVPVLCSDQCGARDLLADPIRGEVFKAGSVDSLGEALTKWIKRGKRTSELTERIKSWSSCLEGGPVADYFAGVLQHVYEAAPRPTPPWCCP